MSRIISYPYDSNVVDADAWIGTEASTTRTKQYTASAVADYLNINGKISIGGQMVYQYVANPLQAVGTFSITSGGLDNVPFANITTLTLSSVDKGGQNVVAFLNYLIGSDILISKQNEISTFGHYEVVSYNVSGGNAAFYDLVVVFKGGNGSMNFLDFYDAINFTLASEIIGLYTFNVDSDNGAPFTVQNNGTIDFTSTNITVSNVNSAISFNLPVTGVTAGAYTAANITVDSFGRITDAADGASGPGGTGTTNFVTKWVNATTLGDSVIFDNGTNVGIGTSSPSDKLTVNGNARITGVLKLASGSAGAPSLAHRADENTGLFFPLNDNIGFTTSNSEKMRITSAGNVGIGTTSPSASLQIGNAVSISSEKLDVRGNSSGNYVASFEQDHVTGYGVLIDTDGTLSSHPALRIKNTSSELFYVGSNGNVGIGTTIPSAKLQIQQSADNIGIRVFGFDDRSSEYVSIHDNGSSGTFASTSNIKLQSGGSGYAFIDSASDIYIDVGASSNDFKFRVPGLGEIFTIKGSGNVGIGTTSPSSKLHVEGTLQVIETNPITAEPNGSRIIAAIDSRGGGDTGGLGIYTGDNNNDEPALLVTNYLDAEKFRILGASGDIRSAGLIRSTAYGGGNVTGTAAYNLEVDSNGNIIETAAGGGLDNWTLTGNNIYNNNSGNVGIGTTSPSAKLEVAGTSGNTNMIISDSSANSEVGIKLQNDVKTWTIQNWGSGDDNLRILNNVGNTIQLWDDNGNVGIGTTSPSVKLEVASGHVRLTDAYSLQWGSANNRIYGQSSNTVFVNNANESMRILTNGNIGIGTTAPNQKLDVNGNIKSNGEFQVFIGTTDIGQISNLAGALNIQGTSTRDVSLGSDTNPQSMFIEGVNGKVGIGTTGPNAKLTVRGSSLTSEDLFHIEDSGGVRMLEIVTDPVGNASLQIKDTSGSTKSLINSAGNSYLNGGNVGIGTTSPSAKLQVAGSFSADTGYFDSALTTGSDLRLQSNITILNKAQTSYISCATRNTTGSEVVMDLTNIGSINGGSFLSNWSTSGNNIYSNNSGNVGIGTTSPSEKLGVFGNIRLENGAQRNIIGPTNENLGIFANPNDSDEGILFSTDNGVTTEMIILNGGNVGIGTTSPTYKLHNIGTSRLEGRVTLGGNVNNFIQGTGSSLDFKSNGEYNFTKGANTLLRILSTGNVGIGTTTPGYKLEVNSGTTNNIAKFVSSDGGGVITVKDSGGEVAFSNVGNDIFLKTSSSQINQMSILNSGNVGIGTNTPTQKLHVDGNTLISAEKYYYIAGTGAGFGSDASGNFKIKQNGADLIFGSGNNVGIGITNASYKLDVQNVNQVARFQATGTGSLPDVLIVDADTSNTRAALQVQGNSGATEVLFAASGGYVGIGTTAPSEKLDISAGSIRLDDGLSIKWASDDANVGRVRISGNEASDFIQFVTDNSEKMRLTNTGLGIGTTNPQATLDVNGPIKIGTAQTLAASSTTVGAIRYRAGSNNSYMEMVMQTGISGFTPVFAWVIIKQNTW